MIQWNEPGHDKNEPIYLYDNPNQHQINIDGIYIEQHGKKIRIVSMAVQDLDRISRTPTIGNRNNVEMTQLFRQPTIDVWQRSLNHKRLPIIAEWWKNDPGVSPNNSVLYFDDIEFDDNETHKSFSGVLNPADWCFQKCPACLVEAVTEYGDQYEDWWMDCCHKCGYNKRPATVVDGQHRIRGMSYQPDSSNAHLEPVFSTWLCAGDFYSRNDVARIFTEITSAAVSLDKLHKEFLMAKFKLPKKYAARGPGSTDGKIRRRAYSICSELNSSSTPWGNVSGTWPNGRVEMIERSQTIPCDVITIERLTNDFVFKWMTSEIEIAGYKDYPLLHSKYSDSQIVSFLENFLVAVLRIFPTSTHWDMTRFRKGLLQPAGVFRLIMSLFEYITVRLHAFSLPLSINAYAAELKYIENIDFNTPALKQYLSSDSNINSIRRIFRTLYNHAPRITAQRVPSTINRWMSDLPDKTNLVSASASIASDLITIKYESVFIHSHVTSLTLGWPLNAVATATLIIARNGSDIIEVDCKTSGGWSSKITKLPSTSTGGPIVVGDSLEVTIHFKSFTSQTNPLVIPIIVVA